jgi:hypothetical protein
MLGSPAASPRAGRAANRSGPAPTHHTLAGNGGTRWLGGSFEGRGFTSSVDVEATGRSGALPSRQTAFRATPANQAPNRFLRRYCPGDSPVRFLKKRTMYS